MNLNTIWALLYLKTIESEHRWIWAVRATKIWLNWYISSYVERKYCTIVRRYFFLKCQCYVCLVSFIFHNQLNAAKKKLLGRQRCWFIGIIEILYSRIEIHVRSINHVGRFQLHKNTGPFPLRVSNTIRHVRLRSRYEILIVWRFNHRVPRRFFSFLLLLRTSSKEAY